MHEELLEAVDLCRNAADNLDSDAVREGTVLFPGWDYSGVSVARGMS